MHLNADPFVTSLKIKGIAVSKDCALGDIEEKVVHFSEGISQSDVGDDPNWPEFVKFMVTRKTPNKIDVATNAWNWIVTEVNGTAVNNLSVDFTSGNAVYTVLAAPTAAPWTQTTNALCNAWVTALALVCSRGFAGGATSTKQAAEKIAKCIYSANMYPDDGNRRNFDSQGFNLSDLISRSCFAQTMNCEDIATSVVSLGNVVGCSNQMARFSFGFTGLCVSNLWCLPQIEMGNITLFYHYIAKGPDGIIDATYKFKDPNPLATGRMPLIFATGIPLDVYLILLGTSQNDLEPASTPPIH